MEMSSADGTTSRWLVTLECRPPGSQRARQHVDACTGTQASCRLSFARSSDSKTAMPASIAAMLSETRRPPQPAQVPGKIPQDPSPRRTPHFPQQVSASRLCLPESAWAHLTGNSDVLQTETRLSQRPSRQPSQTRARCPIVPRCRSHFQSEAEPCMYPFAGAP
jgi:hypothetical protein